MIEGGYPGQKNIQPLAHQCAKAMEPVLDHLGQDQQMSILAAVESVVHELLGFSAVVEKQTPDGYYTKDARSKEELLADPSAIAQIKKEHVEKGGDPSELPW